MRALLSIRSVDFDSFDIGIPGSPFKPIGLATAVPDFGTVSYTHLTLPTKRIV